ncbi:MAG: murein hydrolase activator EnvC family protein [Desulfopila sp.]
MAIALLVTVGLCCDQLPATAQAATTQDIQADIERYRDQIRRLEQNIHEQQTKVAENLEDEANLLGELENIEERLKNQQRKVDDLDIKVQLQQLLLNLKHEELDNLQTERQGLLFHLEKRSKAFYKMGKVGFLNVAFSSHSLPQLLKFHDAFQNLVIYDKKIILDYRQKIRDLQMAHDAHALELNVLNDFIAEATAEKEKIGKMKVEKEQLLAQIRTQKHLHDQATREMAEAAASLAEKLHTLKGREQIEEKTFANGKGRLPAPLPGRVITYFNQEKFNRLGVLRKSQGIAIAAPDGTNVRAVAPGTVIFAGYLRGYGNTVIIHHGYQYYTVTSRLENIAVKEGDQIRAGATLGQASETAALIDEGVYFEIRHGSIFEDPLSWLDVSRLEHSKHLQEFNRE